MRIYSSTYRENCDVLGISISLSREKSNSSNVILYIKNNGMFGLGTEEFSEAKIIDKDIGNDFRAHYFNHGDGIMILWNHFADIDHLSRLIDLDPETVAAFEVAYASRSTEKEK